MNTGLLPLWEKPEPCAVRWWWSWAAHWGSTGQPSGPRPGANLWVLTCLQAAVLPLGTAPDVAGGDSLHFVHHTSPS